MHDSKYSVHSCQPPQPRVQPPHVPADVPLPVYTALGGTWKDSACIALSHVPAVAAKIRDVIITDKGDDNQHLNYTPQQWDTVSTLNSCIWGIVLIAD
jgi:hypothetical protein